MLSDKLEELKSQLILYANLVRAMIENSIQGLLNKDKAVLKKVIGEEEPKANALDLSVDQFCTNLIAQFEPKAKDLRTILMIAKMSTDLERMADHAVNISLSALDLIEQPPVKPLIDIPKMAEATKGMLMDSIQAFIHEDAELATQVCARDDSVDSLRNRIFAELMEIMSLDSTTVRRSLDLIRITQNLERVADLSTNIGEDVIFMVSGKVIKHHHEAAESPEPA